MGKLDVLLRRDRTIRAMGFDDAPFARHSSAPVPVAGVACAGTRLEGMVWGHVARDGWDATPTLAQLLLESKFLPQLHVVLLDGICLGGLNAVDLPALAGQLERPCIAVMRRPPDAAAMERAMQRLPHPRARWAIVQRAGPVRAHPPFYFQACGTAPATATRVLERLTDCGRVPEPLRLAHAIGSAVVLGESRGRA